jgi:hypothetical protein
MVETHSRIGSGLLCALAIEIRKIDESKADRRRIEASPLIAAAEHQRGAYTSDARNLANTDCNLNAAQILSFDGLYCIFIMAGKTR